MVRLKFSFKNHNYDCLKFKSKCAMESNRIEVIYSDSSCYWCSISIFKDWITFFPPLNSDSVDFFMITFQKKNNIIGKLYEARRSWDCSDNNDRNVFARDILKMCTMTQNVNSCTYLFANWIDIHPDLWAIKTMSTHTSNRSMRNEIFFSLNGCDFQSDTVEMIWMIQMKMNKRKTKHLIVND